MKVLSEIITFLYLASGFTLALSYIPQIRTLRKDKEGRAMSLTTLSIWSFGSIVTLVYAVINNGDKFFISTSIIVVVGNLTMFYMIFSRRLAAWLRLRRQKKMLSHSQRMD